MNEPVNHINEQQVALAFTGQSAIFDQLYATNGIVAYKRERVRQFLLKYLRPGSRILELNAGTGDDAIFLAKQGHHVHATDISTGMQARQSKGEGIIPGNEHFRESGTLFLYFFGKTNGQGPL